MRKKFNRTISLSVALLLMLSIVLTGCGPEKPKEAKTRIITDQVGRKVEIPVDIERVAAFHMYAAKIMYSLGQGDKLIHKAIYHPEATILAKLDEEFAALPNINTGDHKQTGSEPVLNIGPQIVFSYAAFDTAEIEQFEEAGLVPIGVKGETLEDTYETIALLGDIFNCKKEAKEYTEFIKSKYKYVDDRTKKLDESEKPVVLITGPKSIYTVATGEMLQNEMIEMGGGINPARGLKGRWAEISPEQLVTWNPDYIFLGSSFGNTTKEEIYNDPAFATISAVKNKRIYIFPSNIGWWDFPLPQAMLGMVWTAKKINPDLFKDMDVEEIADEYYMRCFGYSFEEMGGILE